ncbi:hypothetical protein HPO96_35990 [Kribbella sandramycini]|uniref:Ricin B lectin domain-containing protein n=1 Tax=Kribbella sandramycini TaxID=60450 RepID=A0A7Y4L7B8_9ACTN|nr:hypothetical protein [Kribbella sandramycini]NOL45658.1 hypothetical protein [Kribbella sandramycini]
MPAAADPPERPIILNLVNQHSGLCLTATDASQSFAVLQLPCNGSYAQKWQSEWLWPYMMDLQHGRCLTALPGTSALQTTECSWKRPGQPRDPKQDWAYDGGSAPTKFANGGLCLGVLPGNSWARRLDCNTGPAVTWYR